MTYDNNGPVYSVLDGNKGCGYVNYTCTLYYEGAPYAYVVWDNNPDWSTTFQGCYSCPGYDPYMGGGYEILGEYCQSQVPCSSLSHAGRTCTNYYHCI